MKLVMFFVILCANAVIPGGCTIAYKSNDLTSVVDVGEHANAADVVDAADHPNLPDNPEPR